VRACGVGARVTFLGAVPPEDLVSLYSGARGVLYVPFDEDYGYVTLEAFLSGKPVITCHDSGGTLEFVIDGENGFVCAPEPDAVAAAIGQIAADRGLAGRLGQAGMVRARTVTWDGVVEQLLG
jgi:glycosyltransferase involved in cell wall biosynthesis